MVQPLHPILTRIVAKVPSEGQNRAAAMILASWGAFTVLCMELSLGGHDSNSVRWTLTFMSAAGMLLGTPILFLTGSIFLTMGVAFGLLTTDLLSQYLVSGNVYYLAYLVTLPSLATIFGGWKQGVFWLSICITAVVTVGLIDHSAIKTVATVRPISLEFITVLAFLSATGAASLWAETVRTRSEQQARELAEQANHLEVLRGIGEYSGMVAHNFNNLLTAIMCNAELLEESSSKNEILSATENAASLTARLLALGQPETATLEEISLHDIIDQNRNAVQGIVRGRTRVEVELGAYNDTVLANELLLQQVLLNLATNSRDALGDGGHLRIATRSMNVDASDSGEHADGALVLTISDTGCGMQEDTRQKALQPFFTTKSTGQGTGLGLPFVARVIDQLGGRINIDSAPDQGTTVTIELPVVRKPPAESEAVRSLQKRQTQPESAGDSLSILLVDDNPLVRDATQQLLKVSGMHVETADCSERAMQLLHGERRFDVLITDYVMPGQNGMQLGRQAAALHPDLRVLLISGYQDEPLGQDVLASIDARFLSKPFQRDDLLQAIRDCRSCHRLSEAVSR